MISVSRELISHGYADDIFETIRKIVTELSHLSTPESILGFMKNDKKYKGGRHTCILITDDSVKIIDDIEDKEVLNAIETTFRRLMEPVDSKLVR